MKESLRIPAVICVLMLVVGAAPAGAQMGAPTLTQFSADMEMKGPKRGDSMTGKMYFGGKLWRWDMDAGGHKMSNIIDGETETMYMIMPEQKMYMEMRGDQRRKMPGQAAAPEVKPVDPNDPCADDPETDCKKVGSEVVNGRNTDKWVFTDKRGRERQTVWVDQKLHFPIRVQSQEGFVMELTNIQEGPQPASLFQVPAGYQKLDMGGMMPR